nr:MAG TPA: hypothetical protein [Bacteriophage sp.]
MISNTVSRSPYMLPGVSYISSLKSLSPLDPNKNNGVSM